MSRKLYRLFLSFFFLPTLLHCFPADSLDLFLEEFAFKAMIRHTGALYKANLPSNVSGMEVSIMRIRSRTLWKIGASFTNFKIHPRTIPVPHVKRVAIVYIDVGNRSSRYYNVPGYSLVTSVIGFTVFDASIVSRDKAIIRKVSLNATRTPITLHFKNVRLNPERAKCVSLSGTRAEFSELSLLGTTCYSKRQGRFAIVVPVKRKQRYYLWIIGFGVVLVIAMVVLFRILRTNKIEVTERQVDEGEVFENRWISDSKMPCANVTRTQPVLESGRFTAH